MTIIYGIGVDLLHIPRMAALINRRGTNKIALRILSPSEQSTFSQHQSPDDATRFLGVRWAVKEAAYKALYPLRPTWKELTFTTFDLQTGTKPTLVYHPNIGDPHPRLHVSVSHDGGYILAYVVAEDAA